jgi:hypothetical protein
MTANKRTRRHVSVASAQRATAATPAARRAATDARRRPDWRWRTFPVFAAFAAGLLAAFLVNEGSANPVAFVVQIAALLGVGYSVAHLIVSNVVRAGRSTRRRDDETEDVVVYPDEEPPSERGSP